MELDLTKEQRWYLREIHALTTDSAGREVLVGLTRDESIEYLRHQQTRQSLRDEGRRPEPEERDRFSALRDRHEQARLQVCGVMADKENNGPTSH